MRRARICVLLLALDALSAFCAPSLIRLPLKHTIDPDTASLFLNAIDTVLAAQYRLRPMASDSAFDPDSTVFSAQLSAIGDSLELAVDFYVAQSREAISERIRFGKDQVTPPLLVETIRRRVIGRFFSKLYLARLQITGTRGTEIYRGNELWGRTPFESFVRPGDYDISIRGKRFFAETYELSLGAGDDTTLQVDLWKKTRGIRFGVWSAALVAAGVGAYLDQVRSGQYRTYLAVRSPAQSDYSSPYSAYRHAVAARNASFAASGVFLVTGLLLTFDIPL